MSPTVLIAMLWLGFAATHMGLSSLPVRSRLIAVLGAGPFGLLYSVVALGFFIPLGRVYFTHKHAGDLLWALPHDATMLWIMNLGMGCAFILLVAALVRRSPAAVVPGEAKVAGIYRITRHPLMMAFVLFGLLHLIPNGSTADLAFFGGFVLFAMAGAWHQDHRKLAMGSPGFREFYEQTSFFPFANPGRIRAVAGLSPAVVAVGIGLTVAVRYLHPYWTG